MTSRQLNIRLAPRDRDLLEAVASGHRQPAATLAREIACDYLRRQEGEGSVQKALEARALQDKTQSSPATVHRLLKR